MTGARYCWGNNNHGRLGLGDTEQRNSPTPAGPADGVWSSIKGGSAHTCAINRAHELYCWGTNYDGELGVGDERTAACRPGWVRRRTGRPCRRPRTSPATGRAG
ncbi:hypothetical protein ACFQX7_29835 [Luedemannella flava]